MMATIDVLPGRAASREFAHRRSRDAALNFPSKLGRQINALAQQAEKAPRETFAVG
jgi:hypothetical protein